MIELNEQKAKDLNELLIFAENFRNRTAFNIHFYKNQCANTLELEYLFHLLSLAKFYMVKYEREWFYLSGPNVSANMNTDSFLKNNGFREVLKSELQEQKLKILTEKQLNKNIWQLKYWWIFILINAIMAFIIAKYSK
ncbi:MAG: hypothetical protein ABIN97_04750 [Ginsengibacter sp.]